MMKRLSLIILTFFLSFNLFSQKIEWKPITTINSDYDEFSPSISPDGKSLLFSSNRPGTLGDNDIWISTLKKGQWSAPVNFKILNTRWHDHEPCFSHDGNYILFTSDRDGGYGTGDIYLSYRSSKGWSKPQNLGPKINSADSEKMPSLSMDNKELYFTRIPVNYAQRKLETSQRKIFLSRWENNSWNTPKPLPEPVNTLSLESASRILADGLTLLFSSAREGGKGNYDIWKVERESFNSPWNKLTNLEEINTPYSEVYFGTDLSGETLFLASNRNPRGNFDLYTAKLDKGITSPSIIIQGKVYDDDTGTPLEAEIIVEIFEGNKTTPFTIISDPNTGKYSLALPGGSRYSITANKKGYLFYSRELNGIDLKKTKKIDEDIPLHPLKKGEKVVFNTIYFKPNSDQLLSESYPALEKLLQLLIDNEMIRIRIEGHIADVGTGIDIAYKLSQQRADAIRNYLIKNQISPNRLEALGLGGKFPIGDNSTEVGRKLNRRTEIEVIE